jgi:hypothetical protein
MLGAMHGRGVTQRSRRDPIHGDRSWHPGILATTLAGSRGDLFGAKASI